MAKSLSSIPIILLCCFSYLQALTPPCDRTCGKTTLHYPFTISGRNCRGLPGFEINCSTVAKKPYFQKANTPYLLPITPRALEIVNFSYNTISVVSNELSAFPCSPANKILEIREPFKISENNKFVTVGCNTTAAIELLDGDPWSAIVFSMELWCQSSFNSSIRPLPCKKNGCEYLPIPAGFYKFNLTAQFYDNTGSCTDSGSAVVDENSWKSIQKSETTNLSDAMYPMSLVWAIPSSDNCSVIKKNRSYECAQEAECEDLYLGYVCKCREGYKGDGYINGTGCKRTNRPALLSRCFILRGKWIPAQMFHFCICFPFNDFSESCSIKKSSSSTSYECVEEAHCRDLEDGYRCDCPETYTGNGEINGTGCKGACLAFVVALFGGGSLFWALKRRNLKLAKQRNFDRNGGAQLQTLLSSRGVESTRLFTLDEINKATNTFSESLVLGTGGYGTVYKATLNDGTIVAVKKSKEIDSKEIDQFLNEVVILSQINHRNVVKLLGCCLETTVPLLVYEYISNGTLFELLHSDKYDDHPLVWEDRLRIATETAEALSYLHSSAASMPVVHRDVKSSNILLDDGYNSKVADFGVSRLVPMGQTHVTTVVQGTLGYLDPEYFQTVQLTEKSDVYSFGVVLVKLLTGLKPVSYERMRNQSNLAIFFLSTLKSNGLIGIIDPRLNAEESRNMESMRRVAKLAKECLSVEGEKRPAMKEVVHDLLYIRNGTRNHPWLDVDAVEKEEEMISLIAAESEQSDETKGSRATAEESYCITSVPFSIERFREGNSGR